MSRDGGKWIHGNEGVALPVLLWWIAAIATYMAQLIRQTDKWIGDRALLEATTRLLEEKRLVRISARKMIMFLSQDPLACSFLF